MSARITIQSGIAEGTSHIIEGRVARVGSDPQSDVCLPTNDIPSHALTLEFREEGCLVYNRCRDSVYVGSQAVEPDHVVEWPDTDILQIGADTKLLLDFDLGLADADSYDAEHFDYDSPEVDDASESSGSNAGLSEIPNDKSPGGMAKTVLQLGVTMVCLVGCVLLLVRDQNRKSGPQAGPGFMQIISTAIETPEVAPELVKRIQYAEAQRIRGRDDLAHEHYQSIRDDLLLDMDRPEQTLESPNSQILRFVQTRLASDD